MRLQTLAVRYRVDTGTASSEIVTPRPCGVQTYGEYICALASDLPCNVLRINTEKRAQLWNFGGPRVSDLDGTNGY